VSFGNCHDKIGRSYEHRQAAGKDNAMRVKPVSSHIWQRGIRRQIVHSARQKYYSRHRDMRHTHIYREHSHL